MVHCTPSLPTLVISRSDSGPGLKALAEHFGLKMKKETRVARSDWATFQLSKDAGSGAAFEGRNGNR